MANDLLKPETRRQLGAVLQKGFGRIAAADDDFQRSGHASALHSLLRRETGLPVPRAFLTSMATGDASHLNDMAGDFLTASSRGDGFQVNRITNELDGARFLGGLFGGGGGGNPLGGLGTIGGGAPTRGCGDLAGNRDWANPACHWGNLGGMPGAPMNVDGGASSGSGGGSGIWDAITSGFSAFADGVQNAVSSVEEGVQEAGEWASEKWDAATDWFSEATGGQSGADGDASGPGGATLPDGGGASGGGPALGGAAGEEPSFWQRIIGWGDGNGDGGSPGGNLETPGMGGANGQGTGRTAAEMTPSGSGDAGREMGDNGGGISIPQSRYPIGSGRWGRDILTDAQREGYEGVRSLQREVEEGRETPIGAERRLLRSTTNDPDRLREIDRWWEGRATIPMMEECYGQPVCIQEALNRWRRKNNRE